MADTSRRRDRHDPREAGPAGGGTRGQEAEPEPQPAGETEPGPGPGGPAGDEPKVIDPELHEFARQLDGIAAERQLADPASAQLRELRALTQAVMRHLESHGA